MGDMMLDVDIEDQLVEKTGGKLQLTALMQKRMVELKRGARPLIETTSTDLQEIVIQEILQDKVVLAELEEKEKDFLSEARKLSGEGDSKEEREVFGSDLKKVKEEDEQPRPKQEAPLPLPIRCTHGRSIPLLCPECMTMSRRHPEYRSTGSTETPTTQTTCVDVAVAAP